MTNCSLEAVSWPAARRRARQAGVTLIELMVVVVILAALALIAVPSVSSDDVEADFERFVNRFVRDVQRAHMGAIANREDRAILLFRDRYTVSMVLPGSPPVFSLLENRGAPTGVEVFAKANVAADPRRSYSQPSAALSGGEELRFSATGGVAVQSGTAYTDSSATVFFQSTDKKYRARVVIYQSTSYARAHEGW